MNEGDLSGIYKVKKIQEKDIQEVLELCLTNPQYYAFCLPVPTVKTIKRDMVALPPGKKEKHKFYVGLYQEETLICILDLIADYPLDRSAFIGFFMVRACFQGKGLGTTIIEDLGKTLKNQGFEKMALGYVKGNDQARRFWEKNDFQPTGISVITNGQSIVTMEKMI